MLLRGRWSQVPEATQEHQTGQHADDNEKAAEISVLAPRHADSRHDVRRCDEAK